MWPQANASVEPYFVLWLLDSSALRLRESILAMEQDTSPLRCERLVGEAMLGDGKDLVGDVNAGACR